MDFCIYDVAGTLLTLLYGKWLIVQLPFSSNECRMIAKSGEYDVMIFQCIVRVLR